MPDFSENEALNGTEDLALPFLHIHPRFYPFPSPTASQGGSRGRIPLCPSSFAFRWQLLEAGAVSGPFEPRLCLLTPSCPELEGGDSRGAATGSWPWQAAGQGRVPFCAGHKEKGPRGTKRVKKRLHESPGAARSCAGSICRLVLCRLPLQQSWVPSVSSILPRAPPRCAGLSELRVTPTSSPAFPFPFQLFKQQRC